MRGLLTWLFPKTHQPEVLQPNEARRPSSARYYNAMAANRDVEDLVRQFGIGRAIAWLRTIDPILFEDMVLAAFASRGFRVKFNRHRGPDGGVDGRVYIGDQTFLMQAKRYSSTIRPQDLQRLCRMCESSGCSGLFVHTGRTGKKSYSHLGRCRADVTMISGDRLIDLLTGRPLILPRGRGIVPGAAAA